MFAILIILKIAFFDRSLLKYIKNLLSIFKKIYVEELNQVVYNEKITGVTQNIWLFFIITTITFTGYEMLLRRTISSSILQIMSLLYRQIAALEYVIVMNVIYRRYKLINEIIRNGNCRKSLIFVTRSTYMYQNSSMIRIRCLRRLHNILDEVHRILNLIYGRFHTVTIVVAILENIRHIFNICHTLGVKELQNRLFYQVMFLDVGYIVINFVICYIYTINYITFIDSEVSYIIFLKFIGFFMYNDPNATIKQIMSILISFDRAL